MQTREEGGRREPAARSRRWPAEHRQDCDEFKQRYGHRFGCRCPEPPMTESEMRYAFGDR